jgi:serine protease AprX
VREYYRTKRNWSPSAALVRATLVNGARKLSGADANGSNQATAVPEGNFDQGFGRVELTSSIPNPVSTQLALVFVDNWQSPATQFTRTGDRKRYRLKVRAGFPLRICLAYTDFPARALQNNLNLFVQHPNNKKSVGNERLRLSLGLPDGDNNVEVVFIKAPADGVYLIQVSTTNILHAPQDFALVVTGDLDGDLTEV